MTCLNCQRSRVATDPTLAGQPSTAPALTLTLEVQLVLRLQDQHLLGLRHWSGRESRRLRSIAGKQHYKQTVGLTDIRRAIG